MQNLKKFFKKTLLLSLILAMLLSLANAGIFNPAMQKQALAAGNLLKNGSFEGDIYNDWGFWQNPGSSRTYNFYRAYTAPLGYGSYSAVIDAAGTPEDPFNAILSSNSEKNAFQVQTDTQYILSFYAKATEDLVLSAYLQRSDNYNSLTGFPARTITTSWQKYIISLTPNASAGAMLAFVCGSMPDGSSLYIDGVNLTEADFNIGTSEVKGRIGDTNKNIRISNIGNFEESDIEVELPYFDPATGQSGTKRFNPVGMNASGIYIDLWEGTYSGLGRIYIDGVYIGDFNYNITPVIKEYLPVLPRADADLVIYGSGFMPVASHTFLVLNTVDLDGHTSQIWIEPSVIDSKLSQMAFKLPYGIVSGRLYIQTSFADKGGADIVNKSNTLNYKVKPIIFANGVEWEHRGYEQVGDKLLIHGKGMGKAPSVNFYNELGKKIDTQRAKLVQIYDHEIIEVRATKKYNNINLTVVSGGVESDIFSAQNYLAKPKIDRIKSKYSRTVYASSEKVQAAKVGDIITISGQSLLSNVGSSSVEFQGISGRIETAVGSENINKQGTALSVSVPAGAQNGVLGVRVNGQISNYLPYEIVPSIISISPDPIVPGEEMTIVAQGVGNNLNLAKIYFSLDKNNKIYVAPESITYSASNAIIKAMAPMAISNHSTQVSLQYDRWRSNGGSVLNVTPTITSASINMDNKILSIRGYGFSVKPKENVITYKYNDENKTVITPKVRMLGVYPTEEGQEIRIKILDDYHYGFVSVAVGGLSSNEVNFGPVSVRKVARRIEYVESAGQVMGVLYISGYNFGSNGDVRVGDHWAVTHYRSDFFIIAVIEEQYVYDNPVIVTKQ